jgi:hypothetical protein
LSLSGRTITATVQQGTHALSSDQFPGTLTFSVDGQVLSGGSISVNSNGSYTFDVPSSASDETVTVTLIDSVLYDDVKTIAVPGSGGSGGSQTGGPLTFNATTTGSGISKQIVFTWSGGTPNYDVYKGNVPVCTNRSDSGCSVTYNTFGSGTYKLTDDNNQTKTVSVP